jgi:hypothetical protein
MPLINARLARAIGVAEVIVTLLYVTAARATEAPNGKAEVITAVSIDDVKGILKEAGADVQTVDFTADGFTITATLTPERHVHFEGMECKGVREAMACAEFKISARWQVDTGLHAEKLAKALSYNYTSIFADGNNIDLWRMDFIYGGVTREHFSNTVLEFFALRNQAENTIWPTLKKTPPKPIQN